MIKKILKTLLMHRELTEPQKFADYNPYPYFEVLRILTIINSIFAIILIFFMEFEKYHFNSLMLYIVVFSWGKLYKRI